MRVWRAGDEDQAVVAAMRVAFVEDDSFGSGPTDDGFRTVTRGFIEEAHADGSLVSWLAEDGADCVGIVSMLICHAPPRPTDVRTRRAYVVNMYVRPSHRGRGVAQALLDALLAEARVRDLRALHLYATDAGRPLYERAGFVPNAAWMEMPL